MSNESLNDFYNQNRFNKKLRERIDSFEPELSDSLWDRIEHDLVKKENRSKRAVWMVYVMGGLLLLSGLGIYHLANENQKLAEAIKNQEEVLQQEIYTTPEVRVEREQFPDEIIAENGGASNTAPALSNTLTIAPNVRSGRTEASTIGMNPHPSQQALISEELGEENAGELLDAEDNEEANQALMPLAPNDKLESINTIASAPVSAFTVRPTHPHAKFVQARKGKNIVPGRVRPYVGLTSELGSNKQLVKGPYAARFNHEHPFMYNSKGLQFGVKFRNGLFVQSGLSSSVSGANLWYDFKETFNDTVPGIAGPDSLVAGKTHVVNKQFWIDIPVQLGYIYSLNSNWALTGQAGITYSIINAYSGFEPNQGFSGMDQAGEARPHHPFKNYWSMSGSAGIAYQLGNNWMIDLQAQYRRGLQNFNGQSLPNHPNRTNEFLGGRLGIRYIMR
ncbi:MAG: hypothetical protein GC180_10290 [Bacteroidetes bacterium]|nr:hypothetical protein [Bacteroidota bacterium]